MAVSLIDVLDLLRFTKVKDIHIIEQGMTDPVKVVIGRKFRGCLYAEYNGLSCSFSQLDKHLYRITSNGEWASRIIDGVLVIAENVFDRRPHHIPYMEWSDAGLATLNSTTLDRLVREGQLTPERLTAVIALGCGYLPMPAVKPLQSTDSQALWLLQKSHAVTKEALDKARSRIQEIMFYLGCEREEHLAQSVYALKGYAGNLEADIRSARGRIQSQAATIAEAQAACGDYDKALPLAAAIRTAIHYSTIASGNGTETQRSRDHYTGMIFGYDRIFQAIAAAVRVHGTAVAISVADFETSMLGSNPERFRASN